MLLTTKPAELFLNEAVRIVDEAEKQGIRLRVMGALAVRLSSVEFSELHKRLRRLGAASETSEFTDIDVIGYGGQRSRMEPFFKSIKYSPHPQARKIPVVWSDRHMYLNPDGLCHVDVFFDKLEMSHTLDLRGRLELDYPTITAADLLLEKMQIVQINEKDIKDSIVLIRSHELAETESKGQLNIKHLAEVLANDWGFWYTVTSNLAKTREYATEQESLLATEKDDVSLKINAILKAIEEQPKTMNFNMRARIGTKKKWYNDIGETFRT